MVFTDHARCQILDRSTLTEEDVERYVSGYSVPIARQEDGRERLLFFAPEEETWYIVVRAADQAIITFMPYDYKARVIGEDALKMARKKHVVVVPPVPAIKRPKCLVKIEFRLPLMARYLGTYECTSPYTPESLTTDSAFRCWVQSVVVTDERMPEQCAQQPKAMMTCHRKGRATELGRIGSFLS